MREPLYRKILHRVSVLFTEKNPPAEYPEYVYCPLQAIVQKWALVKADFLDTYRVYLGTYT